MLIIPAAAHDAARPYKFKATGINVFSLEEALYHCLHYWKQSVDDFCCEEFTAWVKAELGLSYISSKIRELEKVQSFAERLMRFLALTDYLDFSDIEGLRGELTDWESRKEWEKLKERGDDLMNKDEPEKAFALYNKALLYAENMALYNNAAIALMKQGNFSKAVEYLKKALYLSPDNTELLLHLAEACILDGDFAAAGKYLTAAGAYGERAEVYFFQGEIRERAGDVHGSVPLFEKAVEINPEPHYIYRLADVFVKLRQFEKAARIMEQAPAKDKGFLKKQAEIQVKNNNIPAAIKFVEQALTQNRNDAHLWAVLASYYLRNYDHDQAHSAIMAAIAIDPDSARVNLEYARVRKAQGRIKDYQVILKTVLDGLKNRYRDNVNYE